jgi:hypothetical protein
MGVKLHKKRSTDISSPMGSRIVYHPVIPNVFIKFLSRQTPWLEVSNPITWVSAQIEMT